MNLMLVIGLIMAGGTIAFDKLICSLLNWPAIVLYSIPVILFINGMGIKQEAKQI